VRKKQGRVGTRRLKVKKKKGSAHALGKEPGFDCGKKGGYLKIAGTRRRRGPGVLRYFKGGGKGGGTEEKRGLWEKKSMARVIPKDKGGTGPSNERKEPKKPTQTAKGRGGGGIKAVELEKNSSGGLAEGNFHSNGKTKRRFWLVTEGSWESPNLGRGMQTQRG